MSKSKKYFFIFKLFFLSLLIAGCIHSKQRVEVVYDGDTFKLSNGEKVRLLGINTPEIGDPGADIAKDFLEKLVLGKEVKLKKDVTNRDKYGRLLRYVYVGNLFVNAALVKKGYAEVRFYPPNIQHKKYFEDLEKIAYKNKKGLWAFSVFQAPIIITSDKKQRKSFFHKKNLISWKDADKYYGEIMTVKGVVVRTYNTGEICFLNFHQDWRKHFQAVIFASDFNKFPSDPEDFYLHKKVYVTGLIKRYKGRPEIILRNKRQIKIVK